MRLAVDCDLRKIYAVNDMDQVWAKAFNGTLMLQETMLKNWPLSDKERLVLFEVASPVFYREGAGAVHQTARWMLYNIHTATQFGRCAHLHGFSFLVAPSSAWTKGHSEDKRQAVARAGMTERNLRECQAMLFFHRHDPKAWVPLDKFVESI